MIKLSREIDAAFNDALSQQYNWTATGPNWERIAKDILIVVGYKTPGSSYEFVETEIGNLFQATYDHLMANHITTLAQYKENKG